MGLHYDFTDDEHEEEAPAAWPKHIWLQDVIEMVGKEREWEHQ